MLPWRGVDLELDLELAQAVDLLCLSGAAHLNTSKMYAAEWHGSLACSLSHVSAGKRDCLGDVLGYYACVDHSFYSRCRSFPLLS